MDNIQDLKRKHFRIKENIKNHMRRGTDISDKLKEYIDIVHQLEDCGVKVNDKSSYILKALESVKTPAIIYKTPHSISEKSTPLVTESSTESVSTTPPQQESFLYKITLAWTERPGHTPDNTIQIIENYLKENGAKQTDSTTADFDGYNEIMKTYEWSGGDKEFAILRRSANYILDIFAENQYEKYNISIFGCKKIQ